MNMLLIIKSLVMLLVMVAIVIDLRCYRLPHYLTWPAAVLAIFGVGYFGDGWKFAIQGAVVGFGLLKIIQVVCRMLLKKECLGSGDCFLMLSLGAIVGPLGAYWSIVLAYLNAWVFSKVFPQTNKMAFGPFLASGFLVILCVRFLQDVLSGVVR